MKLYSIYYSGHDCFAEFDSVIDVYSTDQIKADGAIILWGGEDISSSIYKQRPNKFMNSHDLFPSTRDRFEIAAFNRAQELQIPVIGICRGAQLACAMSGGSLVQHVNGHHGSHTINTFDGLALTTNSIHHQMMNLEGTQHELIASSNPALSDIYYGEYAKPLEMEIEPEIVWFPETKSFAIQGHPEYLKPSNPFVQYCVKQMKERHVL